MQSNNISKEIARNCYSWCCLPPFTALFCFFLSQETLMMQRLWAPRCSPPPLHRYHPLSKRHRPRRPRLPLSTPAFVLTGKMCCLLEGNYIKFFFTNVLVNQSNVSAQSLKLNVWARRYFIFWDYTKSKSKTGTLQEALCNAVSLRGPSFQIQSYWCKFFTKICNVLRLVRVFHSCIFVFHLFHLSTSFL